MDLVQAYADATNSIAYFFDASHSTMHVHAGIAIYLAVQLILRTRRASMVALNVVFVAEILNEAMGFLDHGSIDWPDAISDIVLTMMWPVAMTIVSQYRRARWNRVAGWTGAAGQAVAEHLRSPDSRPVEAPAARTR